MQLLPGIGDFAQKRAAFRRKRHARFFIELFFLETVRCGTPAFRRLPSFPLARSFVFQISFNL